MPSMQNSFAIYNNLESVMRVALEENIPLSVTDTWEKPNVRAVATGKQQVRDTLATMHKRGMITRHDISNGKKGSGRDWDRKGYMWNPAWQSEATRSMRTRRMTLEKAHALNKQMEIESMSRLELAQAAAKDLATPAPTTLQTDNVPEVMNGHNLYAESIVKVLETTIEAAKETVPSGKSIEFVFEEFNTQVTIGKNPITGNMRFSFSMEINKGK